MTPSIVRELADAALHSLPPWYPIADLGDDHLRVADVREALTDNTVDALWVLEVLDEAGVLRPDLVEPAQRALQPVPIALCSCGHAAGFHQRSVGACQVCWCAAFVEWDRRLA